MCNPSEKLPGLTFREFFVLGDAGACGDESTAAERETAMIIGTRQQTPTMLPQGNIIVVRGGMKVYNSVNYSSQQVVLS